MDVASYWMSLHTAPWLPPSLASLCSPVVLPDAVDEPFDVDAALVSGCNVSVSLPHGRAEHTRRTRHTDTHGSLRGEPLAAETFWLSFDRAFGPLSLEASASVDSLGGRDGLASARCGPVEAFVSDNGCGGAEGVLSVALGECAAASVSIEPGRPPRAELRLPSARLVATGAGSARVQYLGGVVSASAGRGRDHPPPAAELSLRVPRGGGARLRVAAVFEDWGQSGFFGVERTVPSSTQSEFAEPPVPFGWEWLRRAARALPRMRPSASLRLSSGTTLSASAGSLSVAFATPGCGAGGRVARTGAEKWVAEGVVRWEAGDGCSLDVTATRGEGAAAEAGAGTGLRWRVSACRGRVLVTCATPEWGNFLATQPGIVERT